MPWPAAPNIKQLQPVHMLYIQLTASLFCICSITMNYVQLRFHSPLQATQRDFVDELIGFREFGRTTETFVDGGLRYFVNEYWTSRQRQSHNLHEISYRACFKAELPRFFVERLTSENDCVYDPFMGRGTTLLEAALLGRRVAGNDINPLSKLLVGPRLNAPSMSAVQKRLKEIDWKAGVIGSDEDLLVFYHPETLKEIVALKRWLLGREFNGNIDDIDRWIRLVAINRLTGHSSGFFSVYTLPPNQAVSIASQRKINEKRRQTPDRRDVPAIILKKSRNLLSDGAPVLPDCPVLNTGPAWNTPALEDESVALIVTSPPFLDIVNYAQDNWLRCWFAGIDASEVRIDAHKTTDDWERFVRKSFVEFARVVKPGGHVAFEVGEVRGGKVLLERHVAAAARGLPFTCLGVMVNDQEFTKTANCWGVSNNSGGTNTNRIVLFKRQ